MPLDWSFTFMRLNNEVVPEIIYQISYQNGKHNFNITRPNSEESKTHTMFLSYIAFFPEKDFTKIKLRTDEHRFAIHFLDKRYVDQNFLASLSISEYDVEEPFELWGVEELFAEYASEYFFTSFSKFTTSHEFAKFKIWLNDQAADFYLDWKEAKEKHIESKKHAKHSQMIQLKFEQSLSLTVLNEYGQPLIDMISFKNDYPSIATGSEEIIDPNLESMSLSARRLLIVTQGKEWKIDYIKQKLKSGMGYQYIFFLPFKIGQISYLIMMNAGQFDYKSQKFLPIFRGGEPKILEAIKAHIEQRPELFSSHGLLNEHIDQTIIHDIIIGEVRKTFENVIY